MNISDGTHPIVVVGVDGSRPSVHALEFAKQFTHKLNGRLRAVSAWNYPAYHPLPALWSPQEDAELQLRNASKEVFGKTLPGWYEFSVFEGSAANTLREESRTADVLVVGSRGHGGFTGLMLGSVSSQIAAHSRCPVIVVHSADTVQEGLGENGQTSSLESAVSRPLVVGHDGSANADDALVWALKTAASLGAPVEVVRTWSLGRIPSQFTEEYGVVPSFDEVTSRVHRDLVAETSHLVERFPSVKVTLRAALSQPSEELIDSSKHALMIVVGSRGRGGFAGLVLGSVSTECAAHALCPVVIVPTSSLAETEK
jgi:nucleotide-binding universal stress UspA family protein